MDELLELLELFDEEVTIAFHPGVTSKKDANGKSMHVAASWAVQMGDVVSCAPVPNGGLRRAVQELIVGTRSIPQPPKILSAEENWVVDHNTPPSDNA